MKIVIAPQAFKGSIGALDAAKAAEQGALKAFPKAEVIMAEENNTPVGFALFFHNF